jgi:hypothetical protein
MNFLLLRPVYAPGGVTNGEAAALFRASNKRLRGH